MFFAVNFSPTISAVVIAEEVMRPPEVAAVWAKAESCAVSSVAIEGIESGQDIVQAGLALGRVTFTELYDSVKRLLERNSRCRSYDEN